MSDIIFIEGLEVMASVGIFDFEKETKQALIIDCKLSYSLDNAGKSNDIADTVSYAEVAATYTQLIEAQHHDLLEHLAERLITETFKRYPVSAIELKLAKPAAVPSAKNVGIILQRTRPQ